MPGTSASLWGSWSGSEHGSSSLADTCPFIQSPSAFARSRGSRLTGRPPSPHSLALRIKGFIFESSWNPDTGAPTPWGRPPRRTTFRAGEEGPRAQGALRASRHRVEAGGRSAEAGPPRQKGLGERKGASCLLSAWCQAHPSPASAPHAPPLPQPQPSCIWLQLSPASPRPVQTLPLRGPAPPQTPAAHPRLCQFSGSALTLSTAPASTWGR